MPLLAMPTLDAHSFLVGRKSAPGNSFTSGPALSRIVRNGAVADAAALRQYALRRAGSEGVPGSDSSDKKLLRTSSGGHRQERHHVADADQSCRDAVVFERNAADV